MSGDRLGGNIARVRSFITGEGPFVGAAPILFPLLGSGCDLHFTGNSVGPSRAVV